MCSGLRLTCLVCFRSMPAVVQDCPFQRPPGIEEQGRIQVVWQVLSYAVQRAGVLGSRRCCCRLYYAIWTACRTMLHESIFFKDHTYSRVNELRQSWSSQTRVHIVARHCIAIPACGSLYSYITSRACIQPSTSTPSLRSHLHLYLTSWRQHSFQL